MSSGSTDGPAAGAGLAVPAERRGAPERAWSRPVWASRTADEIDGDLTGPPSRRWVRWSAVALAVVVLVVAVAGAEIYGRRQLRDAVAEQLRASGITGAIDVSVPGGPVPVVLPALLGLHAKALHPVT